MKVNKLMFILKTAFYLIRCNETFITSYTRYYKPHTIIKSVVRFSFNISEMSEWVINRRANNFGDDKKNVS